MLKDEFTDKYYNEDNAHNKHLFNPDRAANRIFNNSRSVNQSALLTNTTRRMYGSQRSQLCEHQNQTLSFSTQRQGPEPHDIQLT